MNSGPITWTVMPFEDLDARRLYELLRLRTDVFVVEQQCPYPELDGLDLDAYHVLGQDPDGRLVAYARVLPPDNEGRPHIGRVVVHPAFRSRGLGREVMLETLRFLEDHYGSAASALSAQEHLRPFYESLGYAAVSEVYDWDGIPHIDMRLSGPG